jgi:hypothetical protein
MYMRCQLHMCTHAGLFLDPDPQIQQLLFFCPAHAKAALRTDCRLPFVICNRLSANRHAPWCPGTGTKTHEHGWEPGPIWAATKPLLGSSCVMRKIDSSHTGLISVARGGYEAQIGTSRRPPSADHIIRSEIAQKPRVAVR